MKPTSETNTAASRFMSAQTTLTIAIVAAAIVVAAIQTQASSLINIDFGALNVSSKQGPAAIGETGTDFWNYYTRDDGAGGWRYSGALSNLKFANGVSSSVGMAVNNAAGAWGFSSTDSMYGSYVYPLSGGALTLTLTGLTPGTYDLYAYSQDGNYQLNVGATDYGTKTCRDNAFTGTPVWLEGRQFARFAGFAVGAGDTVTMTVHNGLDNPALVAGIQIVAVPEPSAVALVFAAALLRNSRFLTKAKKLAVAVD